MRPPGHTVNLKINRGAKSNAFGLKCYRLIMASPRNALCKVHDNPSTSAHRHVPLAQLNSPIVPEQTVPSPPAR